MLAVGPFDYYVNVNSNIIQSVIGEVSNVYTFLNVSSDFTELILTIQTL